MPASGGVLPAVPLAVAAAAFDDDESCAAAIDPANAVTTISPTDTTTMKYVRAIDAAYGTPHKERVRPALSFNKYETD
jgi:hypothetical protein